MSKLTKKELLLEIYKNIRWNGDALEALLRKNGEITTLDEGDLIGDRPPKRP